MVWYEVVGTMYEENLTPLPHEDGSVVFADQLAEMQRAGLAVAAPPVTPDSVLRWADSARMPTVSAICRRLLLPGSGLRGVQHLQRLVQLALSGKSCLLCLNHRSTLDVPTLFTLLRDHGHPEWFDRIVWVSGRKLEEDVGMTSALVQCVHRVVVSPNTWFACERSEEELRQARLVNVAAERTVARLRNQGWVFALFPAGTRVRLDDPSTREAIEQVQGYLHLFEYLVLANIDGCTMPVSRDQDLTHESPRLDRVIFSFSPVHRTQRWIDEAIQRHPELDVRSAIAKVIIDDIEQLTPVRPSDANDRSD